MIPPKEKTKLDAEIQATMRQEFLLDIKQRKEKKIREVSKSI